jgi:hypothetical protein
MPGWTPAEEISSGVREDILEALRKLPEGVYCEVEGVKVSEGSVIILIFAAATIASHAAGGAAATGGLLGGTGVLAWAADKVSGGALEALGSRITENISGRIKIWFMRKGGAEPAIVEINPQQIADAEAKRLAAECKCNPLPSSGGMRVGANCYRYVYNLQGCAKKLLTITVCTAPLEPPSYTIM